MGLVSKTAKVKWHPSNKKWYTSKGYPFTKMRLEFVVDVKDLTKGSHSTVNTECDSCERESEVDWFTYIKNVKPDGKYFCRICAVKIFSSEKRIKAIIQNGESFAQWGIDNLGEDFLKKYWDYEKNDELGIDPWDITKCSRNSVWIKCQHKEYHTSLMTCESFTKSGNRCPYCHGKRTHYNDSLGQYIINEFGEGFLNDVWSNINKSSPFEYQPKSHSVVYWKCKDGLHDDFKRKIDNSNLYNFRCPYCEFSKGEKKIEKYLLQNDIVLESQKKFNGLIGLGNGLLSYDFYLPKENLLIEFQGKQHQKYIEGFHSSIQDFYKQQEHDKRKKEYSEHNNVKLLEIWYWDFDNIAEILNKELNIPYKEVMY